MSDETVRDDIAFIRRTLEDGRTYARGRSPDFLVWGIAAAAGYVATYWYVRDGTSVEPGWLWPIFLGLPWLYSLRRVFGRMSGRRSAAPLALTANAMLMLWFSCGVFLTTLAFFPVWFGIARDTWTVATVAGVMGIGFFASASLCGFSWMRIVGLGWWAGEIVLFALHGRSEQLLVSAALMLVLLAGPGLLVLRSRPSA